jgi:hypothetical protein
MNRCPITYPLFFAALALPVAVSFAQVPASSDASSPGFAPNSSAQVMEVPSGEPAAVPNLMVPANVLDGAPRDMGNRPGPAMCESHPLTDDVAAQCRKWAEIA